MSFSPPISSVSCKQYVRESFIFLSTLSTCNITECITCDFAHFYIRALQHLHLNLKEYGGTNVASICNCLKQLLLSQNHWCNCFLQLLLYPGNDIVALRVADWCCIYACALNHLYKIVAETLHLSFAANNGTQVTSNRKNI